MQLAETQRLLQTLKQFLKSPLHSVFLEELNDSIEQLKTSELSVPLSSPSALTDLAGFRAIRLNQENLREYFTGLETLLENHIKQLTYKDLA